jgi:hypothetical protein
MYEANYNSAQLSENQLNFEIRDISKTVKVPWEPLATMDYCYGCLNDLLTDNGFRGFFFKKAISSLWFAKVLYVLYLLSFPGIIVFIILLCIMAVCEVHSRYLANGIGLGLIGCFVLIYLELTYGIIVYIRNRRLANAVFNLLTIEVSESELDMQNRFLKVKMTNTEYGVKLETLRVAIQTDSADVEAGAARLQAGILSQETVEVEVMIYRSEWLWKNYYKILQCFFGLSAITFVSVCNCISAISKSA